MDTQMKTSFERIKKVFEDCAVKVNQIKEFLVTIGANGANIRMTESIEYKRIMDYKFDDTISCLNKEMSNIDEVIVLTNLWESYNKQYRLFFANRLTNINNIAIRINDIALGMSTSIQRLYGDLENLHNLLKRDSKYSLFEKFRFGNKNYVLFGKNGAGKTTLLNKLSTELLNTNTVVISATRNINYNNNCNCYQTDIELEKAIKNKEDGKSLYLLAKCMHDEDYLQLQNGVDKDKTIVRIAIKLFEQLGCDRSLSIDNHSNLELYGNNITKYLFSQASDGERCALYIMFVSLLAPQNSFVFIDEPENHLNGALMRKLFDILEEARQDVIFVYATHNIPFIESRNIAFSFYREDH